MTNGHGLIVDVGMAHGEDTEFYLKKGYRVLAIEANPTLVAEASQRLSEYVEDGRLEIVNVAVADRPGEIDFFASERDGWGSTREDWAQARTALGINFEIERVRCDTLANLLSNYDRPHYVKIDIEGSDLLCIESLVDVADKPRYLSVECDPISPTDTLTMLSLLAQYGYDRFKLLNQSLNPSLRCPMPAREGDYYDARFDVCSSGPFGEETPGQWVTYGEVREKYLSLSRHQAVRARYTATGSLFGIPLGRFHRQLHWLYNHPTIKLSRTRYARLRGVDVGGWFDLHAATSVD